MVVTVDVQGGAMELDQWLMVYLALAQTAASKARTVWSAFLGGLIAQALLVIAAAFLIATEPTPRTGPLFYMQIGILAIGLLASLAWLGSVSRAEAESRHLAGLMRGIESQFAGSEFLRSLHRMTSGERVCVSGSNWVCQEWLPSVTRLPFVARLAPRFFSGSLMLAFLLGWVTLLVRAFAL